MENSETATDSDQPKCPNDLDKAKMEEGLTFADEHLSKRKKENENVKDESNGNGIPFEWKQSTTHVYLVLNHGLCPDQFSGIDVEYTDTGVCIKLPDGRNWSCVFFGEIDKESSKVYVRKNNMSLVTAKKIATHWSSLEKPLLSPSSGIDTWSSSDIMTETTEVPLAPSTSSGFVSDLDSASVTPMPSHTSTIDEYLPELVTEDKDGSSVSDDDELPDLVPDDKAEKTNPKPNEESVENENITKEQYSHTLEHVKHDYIEKDEKFTIHIYVKEVDKDYTVIEFEEKSVTVTFRTKEQKFLTLHEGTDCDTNFIKKFHLSNEIVPSRCSYRVTNLMIELSLHKTAKFRWKALEAITRTENTPSSTWIPTRQENKKQSSGIKEKSNIAFDELKDVNVARRDVPERDTSNYDSFKGGATGISNKENIQKPTAKVSPMNKNVMDLERVTTPGFTGLDNLGNTCFMNSVLQSLSNSREFRDFFLDGSFQGDINTDNPLGSKGQLAVSFAVLLKVLWSGKHYSYAPSKLKNLIAMKASQFTGFAQHDAQEFMAFLLDGLHEDLNRVKTKPYTETVDSDGRPDHVVANEAWEVYKKRNNSFIVDLFQGQYKSKLVCPVCGKVSITFDPFLYLSVPLPKKKRIIPVRFMWKDPYKKPILLRLRLPKDATTETLKESASKKTGVSPKDMRVFEAYRGKIYKFYGKKADLSNIQADDTIIIAETLSEEIAGETVHEIYVIQRTMMPNQLPIRCSNCKNPCPEGSKLKRCTKCFKVGYCDQNCQKSHWRLHKPNCKPIPEPVGWPFVLSIPESRATFARLCKLMEAYARYSVDVFQPPVKNENSKLVSQSSLSSSSQSSGSMSSLDSQSSCSSTCTIVADQDKDKEGDKGEDELEDGNASGGSLEAQVGSGDSCGSLNGAYGSADCSHSVTNMPPCIVDSDVQLEEDDNDYGVRNLPESRTFKMPPVDTLRQSMSTYTGTSGPGDEETEQMSVDTDKSSSVPTKPVLGIQTGDADRVTPLFFVKPVNQDGAGLTGADGERLDDKGDIPLDLSDKQFLSMDWKNHEKFDPYVLIQSKEFDCEDDPADPNPIEENPNITLNQCLELFTEPEILSPDEAWYCPQCKEHREASKQLSIWRLPHTLIIQLKRFSFRNFIWRDKIDKLVEFPTRGLDLSPYFIGTTPPDEQAPIYDLYAVVNHYGGILGGHYTSFVRCADLTESRRNEVGWRLCDDSRVTSGINENSVVTRGAYLLFYRRRTPFHPPKQLPPPDDKEYVTETVTKATVNTNTNSESGSDSNMESSFDSKNDITIESVDIKPKKDIDDESESTPLLGNNMSNRYMKTYYDRNYIDNRRDGDSDSDTQDAPDRDPEDVIDNQGTRDIGYTDMDAVD